VGREAELATAAAALHRAGAGRSSVITVRGEAGIGKTRLTQSIVDDARARGMTVHVGQAHPFERSRPFGVVASALGLNRRSSDPRRVALAGLLAGDVADASAGALQYRVVEEVVDLVESACAERPVLLVAEDLHWADSASLLTILSLARQLPLAGLVLVVTARSSPSSADVDRLLDDLAEAGAERLQLRPLGPDELNALAGQVLAGVPGTALAQMLARSGGNPLWAVALLQSLSDEGLLHRAGAAVEVTTSQLPTSLKDLVVRRLKHLPPATLELLQIAAVLGDAVSLGDVAAVARKPPVDVVALLTEAYDAQLLDDAGDRVVFRHQLVHDAIYQQMPPSVRRVLHHEAAAALMAAGAERLYVADHLVRGAERGDEQAVTWLREAAGDASSRAPSVALELLRRAESLLPGGHPEADLVSTEVVQALLHAGQVAEASARAEAVLARSHAPQVDTPLRLALVGALALQNRAVEVVALARESLEGTARLHPAGQVLMLAQQSWALTYLGDPGAAEAAARRAVDVAEHTGDPATTVWALTALMVTVGRQGRFEEALGHARRAAALSSGPGAPRPLPLQPKFFLGLALLDCDLALEARDSFRAALDDEFESGWWLSDTLMADAQVSFALGEWDDAAPRLVAGGQAAEDKDHQLLVSQSMAYRAIIATARGDHRAAAELVDDLSRWVDGEEPTYNAGILAYADAAFADAEGDHRRAYEVLLRCWRSDAGRGNRFYHRVLAPDLVRLALALGHADVAKEVAETVSDGVALSPGVASVRSLALRCRAMVGGELEPMLEAVTLARRTGVLPEHPGICEDAAGLLAGLGRDDEASALLTEALERYEAVGADAWAGRVRAQLRSLGVRTGSHRSRSRPTSGWESLTPTEQAVSELVAEGLTNGAVAKRLYMSPHTVNTHLRHVFAKLDVPNRVALAKVVHHSTE